MHTFAKNDIEILISTQNRNNISFLENIFQYFSISTLNILIINQTTEDNLLQSDFQNIRVINSFEKGLSKSRNLALQNASKKIGIITDDDVVFKPNFQEAVLQGFTRFNSSAAIRFMAEFKEGVLMNSYPKKEKNYLNWLDILNTASVEIVINTEIIKKNNLNFDAYFGLNSTFGMGEEAIFLSDCKAKKLNISFYPQIICQHPQISTVNKISTLEIYKNQGAIMTRIFKNKYVFWIFFKLFFDIKQKNLAISSVFQHLKRARTGSIEYKKLPK